MSAFIVSKKHIDFLVSALIHQARREQRSSPNADALGFTLWNENYKSFNFRYAHKGENDPTPEYKYADPKVDFGAPIPGVETVHAVAVFKAIQCYEYQSCEHEGWDASEAKKLCAQLTESVISWLPGYNNTPWGI